MQIIPIGSSGDFPTYAAAIEALYVAAVVGRNDFELRLLAGETITAPLWLEKGDYRRFTLTAEDTEAQVHLSDRVDFIRGHRADMPAIGTLFNMNSTGMNAIELTGGSIEFLAGCGAKTAWGTGLLLTGGSTAFGPAANFTHAAQSNANGNGDGAGVTAWASKADLPDLDVSDSLKYGGQGAAGGELSAPRGKANRCARYGWRGTDAGTVNADLAEADDCGKYAVYAVNCSRVAARGVKGRRAGKHGGVALSGSFLNVREGDFTDAAEYAGFIDTSIADFYKANITNTLGIRKADSLVDEGGVIGP